MTQYLATLKVQYNTCLYVDHMLVTWYRAGEVCRGARPHRAGSTPQDHCVVDWQPFCWEELLHKLVCLCSTVPSFECSVVLNRYRASIRLYSGT